MIAPLDRMTLVRLGAHFPAWQSSYNTLKTRRWRANNREHWLAKNRQYQAAFRERQKQKELTHA